MQVDRRPPAERLSASAEATSKRAQRARSSGECVRPSASGAATLWRSGRSAVRVATRSSGLQVLGGRVPHQRKEQSMCEESSRSPQRRSRLDHRARDRQGRGLPPLRLELPLRAAPRGRTRRGRACRRRDRGRGARDRGRQPQRVRRLGPDRGTSTCPSSAADDRDVATGSRSPTCPRGTRSSSRSRSPGPRCSRPTTSSSASTHSTTAATRTAGPSTSSAFEQMANLATKAAVEGRQRLQIHAPLIELTQGADHRARRRTRRRLRPHAQLLRPRQRGSRLRTLRLLPAPAEGLPRGRHPRPDQLPGAVEAVA